MTSREVWAAIRAIDGRTPASAPSSSIRSDSGKVAATELAKADMFCQEYAAVSRLPKDKVSLWMTPTPTMPAPLSTWGTLIVP